MVLRVIVTALALSLFHARVVRSGPLAESASREASRFAAASSNQRHGSKPMMWTGVLVAATGVVLAEIAVHQANVSYCPDSTVRGCDENVNKGLLAAGAAAILAGSTLAVVGALPIHARVATGPKRITISRTVSF
jgi:hypothetical protein